MSDNIRNPKFVRNESAAVAAPTIGIPNKPKPAARNDFVEGDKGKEQPVTITRPENVGQGVATRAIGGALGAFRGLSGLANTGKTTANLDTAKMPMPMRLAVATIAMGTAAFDFYLTQLFVKFDASNALNFFNYVVPFIVSGVQLVFWYFLGSRHALIKMGLIGLEVINAFMDYQGLQLARGVKVDFENSFDLHFNFGGPLSWFLAIVAIIVAVFPELGLRFAIHGKAD